MSVAAKGGDRRAAHKERDEAIRRAPAEHEPRLVTTRQVRASMHRENAIGRFNSAFAVLITKSVGTMWCAYVFAIIGAMGITGAVTNNVTLVLLIGAISGYFLQLVLLPIIIVGQNVISAAQDARAEADHETLLALHEMSKTQIAILEGQNKILDVLEKHLVGK